MSRVCAEGLANFFEQLRKFRFVRYVEFYVNRAQLIADS